MNNKERDELEQAGPVSEPISGEDGAANAGHGPQQLKKIIFDDFQISRAEQQAQVDEERKAWHEREERLEKEKPALLRFAVPRLKSLRDEMIGVQNKLPFFRKPQHEEEAPASTSGEQPDLKSEQPESNGVYFAELETMGSTGRAVVPCRPSDGMALVLRQRMEVPIVVATWVFDEPDSTEPET